MGRIFQQFGFLLAGIGMAVVGGGVRAARAGYTLTTLGVFTTTNGFDAKGRLLLSNGVLYGTTRAGGANGEGVVFSVPVTGGTPTVLASMSDDSGANPWGGPALSNGVLYGTTN